MSKMTRYIIFLLFGIFSLASAHADEGDLAQLCGYIARVNEQAMMARQGGKTLTQFLCDFKERTGLDIKSVGMMVAEDAAIEAFEGPAYKSRKEQAEAVENARRISYDRCIERN